MGLGRRVTSVAGGPNSLGALCSFGNLFFLSVFFHDNKKKMRRIMIILSGYLMTLITVFLTSSRTSSVALLFITFIFLFFTNIKIRYKIIFSLIIIGIFISLLPHLIHLNQITEGAGITKHGSYIERIRMWKDTFVDIERSPIFGNGIAKDSMRTWVDNSYVLMLRRIGIFGMIFWILFYLCPLFSVDKKHRDMSWFAFMLIMFALLFSMTANHFTEIKLIDTYVMFIGMALSILNGEKKHAPKSA
jgi:O-antigen ligase